MAVIDAAKLAANFFLRLCIFYSLRSFTPIFKVDICNFLPLHTKYKYTSNFALASIMRRAESKNRGRGGIFFHSGGFLGG